MLCAPKALGIRTSKWCEIGEPGRAFFQENYHSKNLNNQWNIRAGCFAISVTVKSEDILILKERHG